MRAVQIRIAGGEARPVETLDGIKGTLDSKAYFKNSNRRSVRARPSQLRLPDGPAEMGKDRAFSEANNLSPR